MSTWGLGYPGQSWKHPEAEVVGAAKETVITETANSGSADLGSNHHLSVRCSGYLVHVVVVQNVVKVLIDVVEHVYHLHGGAVLADGGEPHNVTEVDCDLLVEFRLHEAFLLQGLDHQPR